MKAKDYYPTYIPRKWIHFTEHGRKYRIRKKYRNRILQTVSSHPSDFETVLFNVMQHTSTAAETMRSTRSASTMKQPTRRSTHRQ